MVPPLLSPSPTLRARWDRLLKKLEVPVDEDADYENTTWCNRDLIPIPPERRTYGVLSYAGYWTMAGSCISAWSTGSTLLAYGLNAQQAIGTIIVGSFLIGILSVVCGWMGEVHHIGFTVASRFSWGMRGGYFPIMIRIFTGCVWFGIQAYWGGQATRVMLGAVIPGLAHLKNTISPSAHLETKDLVGMVVWFCAFVPIVMVPPEKLQKPFFVSFLLFSGTAFGLLIWAVHTAGGGGGPLFHQPATTPNVGWAFVYGIMSVLGAWGGGTLGQSDWTRYASRRFSPTVSQLITAPLTISVTAIIGIIVTSCGQQILGELYWSPITMLAQIQEHYHSSPRARAAVFFGGIGCVATQLAISVVLNSVSTGMDMAGLAPRYINIRRGASIMAAVGVCTNPWQILSTGKLFLAVLSGFGVFIAPMTGVMLADYLVVRKCKLNMHDLYVGNSSSAYWYWHGFHWRAALAWVLGVWPLMPGFITTASGSTKVNGWTRLFNICFVIGISISFFAFWAICTISPPANADVGTDYLDDDNPLGLDLPAEDTAKSSIADKKTPSVDVVPI
ncbi:hypothetical protein AcW1_007757 [Taiwanofungus camphoratus]|nr:hypothetical protein AcW2_007183 [Antrodia cinnamomea]KAI0926839.1 hypothetical protein AcV5_007525 [Antrodia cinnamomea]KAI0926840.1 hypothetical protein AcV5_007525 [Antrodia cinnamomea]KAI0953578.1 hypothetical protein AcW1_007757 [Antrodia cinnamomea]